jgi:hypothetical protein
LFFLLLLFAGVGLIALGSLALVAIMLLSVAFPFMLPVLIPLFIVWTVIAIMRRERAANDSYY